MVFPSVLIVEVMTKSIQVKDNFLHINDYNAIKGLITRHTFPWFLGYNVSGHDNDYQFGHHLYQKHQIQNHELFKLCQPIFEKLQVYQLTRVKFNLLTPTKEHKEHGIHKDDTYSGDLKIALVYFDSSNGYTKFENNEKIYSKDNRAVIFDNSIPHTGATHTDDSPFRITMNINYFEYRT